MVTAAGAIPSGPPTRRTRTDRTLYDTLPRRIPLRPRKGQSVRHRPVCHQARRPGRTLRQGPLLRPERPRMSCPHPKRRGDRGRQAGRCPAELLRAVTSAAEAFARREPDSAEQAERAAIRSEPELRLRAPPSTQGWTESIGQRCAGLLPPAWSDVSTTPATSAGGPKQDPTSTRAPAIQPEMCRR